ncbi:RNA-dependent RNA polymerase [Old schoolhouse virus 2]|uniref:RNA-directed RNA polymerase L n=1 Tax=Old schoolhouse virus 2 TaxID=2447919 RepID=A0A3Q8Q334_9VIRU|nr:RNA-dependent RNA polymerase [Old schoolhouse virus 2]
MGSSLINDIYQELINKVESLSRSGFQFVPDGCQLRMFGKLDSKMFKTEGILRLRGNIAERILCSKYGLKFEEEQEKPTIKELLELINIKDCSSNLKPDAHALTEDGKLLIYEFGINKSKKNEKESSDRQKWNKIVTFYPVILHIETMSSFCEIENPYVRLTLQDLEKLMIKFFRNLERDETIREINLKYYWEIRDLFQQFPYYNKFKHGRAESEQPKQQVLKIFPDLDPSSLPKSNTNLLSNQVKNVVKKRIKEGNSFYRETNKNTMMQMWSRIKESSLKRFRSLKSTKQGFRKTHPDVLLYFEKNNDIILKLNQLNKRKKLKKLDYSYIFKLLGFNEGLVPGPHDSLRWLEAIVLDCESKLKHKGKTAMSELDYLQNQLKENIVLFSSYTPMENSVQTRITLLEQNLTLSGERKVQTKVDTSHNENYVLKLAEKRLQFWKNEDLKTIQDTSVCILRSANTSYTYKTSFICFQKYKDQVVFYKTRGHKTKKFGIITISGFDCFKAHPSRYISPINISLCLENLQIEYEKLTRKTMDWKTRSFLIEILINQNKTSQKNLQNLRYLFMTLRSKYHCHNIGDKLSLQIKNDKNCVDYWLFKNIFDSYTENENNTIFPFDKGENKQIETRKMLFMSYLCNLITRDSQEKDIERVKANQKYFELKINWDKERSWRLNNNLSVEELAYGDSTGPTVCPQALSGFLDWFKLDCLDYLDKFGLTKLKDPLAFEVSNSNSCMTQVACQKFYSKASISRQLQRHHDNKMSLIRGEPTPADSTVTSRVQDLNESLKKLIEFYNDSGLHWVIEKLKTVEPYQLCESLPYLENLKDMALQCFEESDKDNLTEIIKSRLIQSDDPDALHMCILMKIKSIKDELRVSQRKNKTIISDKFVNKISSRNSTAIELLNEIRKEKLKSKEIISELTCIDLLDEIPNLNFGLSYKEQVGGTRELYIGDIKTKIATKIVEEFAKQIKDLNPISCLYDHASENLIRKHVVNCQTVNNNLIDVNFEDLLSLNDEQLSSVLLEKEEFLFGSLDHSKWGPLSMPSLFALLMDTFNDCITLIDPNKDKLDLISDILWKHTIKRVETSSEYVEYLIKKENTDLKTSCRSVVYNELEQKSDQYAQELLKENKLGLQQYPFDMGQGILHGWSDLWAGKTEEFIWSFIKNNLKDYSDVYNCVTSDDQATVLIGAEDSLFTIESHYVLSKCLNKKISEKSVWGTEVFEFKSVFVSDCQELPPTIKFLVIPSFGFEVFDPLSYLNTTDTIMQEAYDNCATIQQCHNLLKMSIKILNCAGFNKSHLSELSEKHFYSCKPVAVMFDNMTFTERKLYSLRLRKDFNTLDNQKLVARIDKELESWMKHPNLSIERAKLIAKTSEVKTWDPLKDGPIRVCSGRIKNNKENNIILSLDPSRYVDDPLSAKLYNFIRKHFQSTTFSSLEQSVIESIKDSLRLMSGGENYSGLVATIRSQSFKLGNEFVDIDSSMKNSVNTLAEDYLQLKIQLLIEKYTLDEQHFFSSTALDESPRVVTEVRGTKINDDFLIPALASLELRDPVFFEKIVKPTIPAKKMKLTNEQQMIRMKLIEASDASFNLEIREPYEVFRLTSLSNNSTYFQGDDGLCWETSMVVGTAKRIYDLKQTENKLILNSFIKPVALNCDTIAHCWSEVTQSEFPNNVTIDGSILQILIAHAINEKRQIQVCELVKSFPQHLSEKRIYQDPFSIIISRDILINNQSTTISFSRNKQTKENNFTIYWDSVPKFPEKKATRSLLLKLLEEDEILEWHLENMRIRNKSKLNPNLFDKLVSPVYIKEGSLGYYKYIDGVPTFQEVHTPHLDHSGLTTQLCNIDLIGYLRDILSSYSQMGQAIFEGLVDTKPDYLTTRAGNIITFKSCVATCLETLTDKKKLEAQKLFVECFAGPLVVEVTAGFVLCRPEFEGWIFCTQSSFIKTLSRVIHSPDELPEAGEEESWLD